jgi:autotransporter-associated beta strand protein
MQIMSRKNISINVFGRRRLTMAIGAAAAAALWAKPGTAHGQIFVTNFSSGAIGEYTISGATVNASLASGDGPTYIAVSGSDLFVSNNSGTVGEYTTSGATVNASLVSGLSVPGGIAVSGSDLFVVDFYNNTIGEYTTSGATVNASLVSRASGLDGPVALAVGSDLFVTNVITNTIGEYTTSGATVNVSLVSGLNRPEGIAVSGSDLFVTNSSLGTIGEYTTSGATVNASLVSGLNLPFGIAVSGSDLFVMNGGSGTIGEYTTSGATVNASLVSGLNEGSYGVAVVAPATLTWNNAGGSGDGMHWDSTSQNWNNGSTADFYNDGAFITFNDANNGHYAVTLNTTASPGSVTVNNSAGNYTISGTGHIAGTGSLTKNGDSTATLNTVNTYSGGTIVNAGTLVVGVNGALPDGSLSITGGTLQLAASTGLASLTSLSITGSGALDITNNHIVLSYGVNNDPISAIASYIASGYNNGAWNGPGVNSSAAALPANNAHYGLGYADGADGVVAGLSSGQIEIEYTLLGDANLDGVVNGSDFTILVGNIDYAGKSWDQGNFNYDDRVNGSDFTELVTNLGKSASGADIVIPAADYTAIDAFAAANGLMADVPEPATGSILLVTGAAILTRRRRAIRVCAPS